MGFWIMPLALAAMLTTGIPAVSEWFLQGMGYGIDIMIYTATIVAHWPGAAIYVPQTSPGFLYCIVGGGLWLCLWQEKWRWLGLIPLAASLYFVFAATAPNLYISEDLKYVGVRYQDHLYVNSTRTKTFLSENWAHATGLPATSIRRWKSAKPQVPIAPVECNDYGCLFQTQDFKLAYLNTADHLEYWCTKADVLLIKEPLREKRKLCQGPKMIIDRFDTWRNGAYAVAHDPESKMFSYTTVMDVTGHRPWSKYLFPVAF
jgi:competence protein ComEC